MPHRTCRYRRLLDRADVEASRAEGSEEGFAFLGGEIVDHHLVTGRQRPDAAEKILDRKLEVLPMGIASMSMVGRRGRSCTGR